MVLRFNTLPPSPARSPDPPTHPGFYLVLLSQLRGRVREDPLHPVQPQARPGDPALGGRGRCVPGGHGGGAGRGRPGGLHGVVAGMYVVCYTVVCLFIRPLHSAPKKDENVTVLFQPLQEKT